MPKIEIELNELIYQNFLIEICRICDEIYSKEKKVVDLNFKEKEKLALEAFEFLAQLLDEVYKSKKYFFVNRKKFRDFCISIEKKIENDLFCKYYVLKSISQGKLDKNFQKHLTISVLKVMKKKNVKFEISEIDKDILRTAVVIAPLVNFAEILRKEIKKGNAKIWREKETAEELLRYIG